MTRGVRGPGEPVVKKIRDPIHKDVLVDEAALALLDTPKFQRLRRLHQLGTANLVYPGANHTRFEHSLGAFHLAWQAARTLELPDPTALELRAAALLHDVGHGPFSHLTDDILMDYTGRGHVDVSQEAAQSGKMRDILRAHGADPARVAALIGGEGPLGALVAGDLDCDRMDYLVRDAHYTGVEIGVDLARLVGELALTETGVAIRESGVKVAEMLLLTRFMMYGTVYYHHASRVAETMVDRAVRIAVDAGEIDPNDFPRMDDYALVHTLRHSKTPAWRLMLAVDQRKLYKVAHAARFEDVGEDLARALHADRKRLRALEAAIADEANVPAGDVLIDAPAPPGRPDLATRVLTEDGRTRPLGEVSWVIGTLGSAGRDAWRLRVIVPPSRRAEVAAVAARVIARATA